MATSEATHTLLGEPLFELQQGRQHCPRCFGALYCQAKQMLYLLWQYIRDEAVYTLTNVLFFFRGQSGPFPSTVSYRTVVLLYSVFETLEAEKYPSSPLF